MTDKPEFIVLPDLDKKIDEAIHDAINYFDKCCPYCDSLLFTGHIRNKIQIDHYIPISKGGKHVPWNILPVCQKCNSKKLAKKPKLFLSAEKIILCEKYLKIVEEKYVGQIQSELEKYQQIKSIFVNIDSISKLNQNNLETIKSIYEIVKGQPLEINISDIKSNFNPEKVLEELINKLYKVPNEFDNIEKYTATELLSQIQPLVNYQIKRNLLSKTFRQLGFYNKLERLNAYETKKVFYVVRKK